MNRPILAAAALSVLTLAAHFFAGGPQYHTPAMASSLSIEDKAVYTILWHTITIMLSVNSVALIFAAFNDRHRKPLITIISAQYISVGLLFIIVGQSRIGDLLTLPVWIALFLIVACAIWGLKK